MYWFDMSLPVHVAQEALYIANVNIPILHTKLNNTDLS